MSNDENRDRKIEKKLAVSEPPDDASLFTLMQLLRIINGLTTNNNNNSGMIDQEVALVGGAASENSNNNGITVSGLRFQRLSQSELKRLLRNVCRSVCPTNGNYSLSNSFASCSTNFGDVEERDECSSTRCFCRCIQQLSQLKHVEKEREKENKSNKAIAQLQSAIALTSCRFANAPYDNAAYANAAYDNDDADEPYCAISVKRLTNHRAKQRIMTSSSATDRLRGGYYTRITAHVAPSSSSTMQTFSPTTKTTTKETITNTTATSDDGLVESTSDEGIFSSQQSQIFSPSTTSLGISGALFLSSRASSGYCLPQWPNYSKSPVVLDTVQRGNLPATITPKKTRYVTTVFETFGKDLGFIVDDLSEELRYWTEREHVICCEILWLTSLGRSRKLEQIIRDCLNRSMVEAKHKLLRQIQIHQLPSSETSEHCKSANQETDDKHVFVGAYRQYTPLLMRHHHQITADTHKEYWMFDSQKKLPDKLKEVLLHAAAASSTSSKCYLSLNLITLDL